MYHASGSRGGAKRVNTARRTMSGHAALEEFHGTNDLKVLGLSKA